MVGANVTGRDDSDWLGVGTATGQLPYTEIK